ncbi:MAG: hypothetical protein AAGJ09_07785 [Pseudomonadota bacterium]
MSFDVWVAVHEQNWPTVRQVNECLAERNLPISLVSELPGKPLAKISGLGLPVKFDNEQIELEVSIIRLNETVGYASRIAEPQSHKTEGRPQSGVEFLNDLLTGLDFGESLGNADFQVVPITKDTKWEEANLNDDLKDFGYSGEPFSEGDYVVVMPILSRSKHAASAYFFLGSICECFGGFGFEYQGMTSGYEPYGHTLIELGHERNERTN